MSQLGMMVIAVGLSSYNVALFHLVNHAFYKALLFLGAGVLTVPALISANCWKLHRANLDGQSAGNLNSGRGFFRDYMLKISYKILFILIKLEAGFLFFWFGFYSLKNKSRGLTTQCSISSNNREKNLDKKFSSYLAGLIEGDGSIYIPKNERDNNNKIISPIISIVFNAKDLPLAIRLQEKLGTGQLVKVKAKKAYTLRISNYKNLAFIVNIINGFMRTGKIEQLNKLIYYLNNKGYDLKPSKLDLSPMNSNA